MWESTLWHWCTHPCGWGMGGEDRVQQNVGEKRGEVAEGLIAVRWDNDYVASTSHSRPAVVVGWTQSMLLLLQHLETKATMWTSAMADLKPTQDSQFHTPLLPGPQPGAIRSTSDTLIKKIIMHIKREQPLEKYTNIPKSNNVGSSPQSNHWQLALIEL